MLPILAVVAGILFLYICKRSVDEIMEDERVQRVSEKVAQKTDFCYIICTRCLSGWVKMAGKEHSSDLATVWFCACVLACMPCAQLSSTATTVGSTGLNMKNRLKVYGAMHNLTQEELAKKLGVTKQTIIAIEKGKYDPSLVCGKAYGKVVTGST